MASSLRVSDNGRHLVRADNGRPFFWLGDTAWLLFQIPTREDADLYLKTRAQQGFTVIPAAIVMGEERVGGTLRPNAYGDLAFVDGDPARPAIAKEKTPRRADEYDYWDHADYIIERAEAHGLILGLLPLFVALRGDGYKYLTPGNAYEYGLFLGKRYAKKKHIVWILGGDNTPDTEDKQTVWNRVAKGIAVGTSGAEDYRQSLMTYHINGNNSSSRWFHASPWLDFNMIQVWGKEAEIYAKIAEDYRLSPVKPTGLGEGSYEDGPQYPTKPIDAWKVRQQAYWSYFAGGYHTYGNTDTWNFSSYKGEATQDWKAALHSEGASHLSVLAHIFASLEWWQFVPIIRTSSGESVNSWMRSKNNRILFYLSHSSSRVGVGLDSLLPARATWIDPRSGERASVKDEMTRAGTHSFSVPQGWQDALLLIETAGGHRGPQK